MNAGFPHELIQFQAELIDAVTEPIDEGEVLRYLGYPAGRRPSQTINELISNWIPRAGQRASPRAAYVVLPVVDKDHRRLRVRAAGGEVEFLGAIGQFLGMSRLLVVFLATAGPEVEALASELLKQGEELPAMIANAVGAERAEAAEAAVIERVRRRIESFGFSPTLPYSPGYCGMALSEQRKLFDVFGGETAGVELTSACLMRPIKSVSGLVGLAPAEEVDARGSPCERCELYNCNMRR